MMKTKKFARKVADTENKKQKSSQTRDQTTKNDIVGKITSIWWKRKFCLNIFRPLFLQSAYFFEHLRCHIISLTIALNGRLPGWYKIQMVPGQTTAKNISYKIFEERDDHVQHTVKKTIMEV